MAIIERDVVLQGKTREGKQTIDMPITTLKNIEDTADVKHTPKDEDYIPLIDSEENGQMKKAPVSAFMRTAKEISYDNGQSEVEADNVQDVLDMLLQAANPQLIVKVDAGSKITIQNGDTILTGQADQEGIFAIRLPREGVWKVTATLNNSSAEDVVITSAYQSYTLKLEYAAKIYGVVWDKMTRTENTVLSRTDEAVLFIDPTPAIGGGSGSSPFDGIAPWNGMVKEEISGNILVKIPKYWYKWTEEENYTLRLQIADKYVEGFSVSPAHADRGDGRGERDFVYVGRYKCVDDYKSTSGKEPKANMTMSQAREGITGLGSGFYQQDYAMFWTIRMLYLVEYADWDGQKVIGLSGGAVEDTGVTDAAQYHTGTMQSSREEGGHGIQYRWIEEPWGIVEEFCDGIRASLGKIYVFNNPEKYSDTSGGTNTGTKPSYNGCILDWKIPTEEGFEWALHPSEASQSYSNYNVGMADEYSYSSAEVFSIGGYGYSGKVRGWFSFYGHSASTSSVKCGARLQYLP